MTALVFEPEQIAALNCEKAARGGLKASGAVGVMLSFPERAVRWRRARCRKTSSSKTGCVLLSHRLGHLRKVLFDACFAHPMGEGHIGVLFDEGLHA